MKKNQLLATLALSTFALIQAGYVSADEVNPVDPSTPATEIVSPTAPIASTTPTTKPTDVETPETQPTEPSAPPVDPTAPSAPQDKDNTSSSNDNPTTPDQPAAPSDKAQDTDNAASPDNVPEEKPKTTDQANQQGKSQIGTTSTSTGQVVHDVTKAPIQTNTGASIVSTQNGNLVLEDGSVVAPESIGAVSNEDKTITVTKADGTKATLPHTGETESFLKSVGVGLLTVVGWLYKKRYL